MNNKTLTPQRENKIIKEVSLVGIVGNILLSAFKLFAGIYGKSGAMVSDSVHSMSDIFATVIALIGVKISKRSADDRHPYGHERFESLASLLLGIILLVTGLAIGKTGIENIKNYKTLEIPGTIALVAAVVSILVKEGMYWYTRHYAKILNSSAFMADAWHHRSDAFSSVGSLAGIGGSMLGYPVMDSAASLVICLFIIKVAADTLISAISNMLDTSGGEEFNKKIKDYVQDQPDVINVDELKSRTFGNKMYVDLEIEVDGSLPLKDAHAIAERIHDGLEETFDNVKHVMVHVNPNCE